MLEDEFTLIVSIHIGISSSASCFNVVSDQDHIEMIRNWPRQSTQINTLPTSIAYLEPSESLASASPYTPNVLTPLSNITIANGSEMQPRLPEKTEVLSQKKPAKHSLLSRRSLLSSSLPTILTTSVKSTSVAPLTSPLSPGLLSSEPHVSLIGIGNIDSVKSATQIKDLPYLLIGCHPFNTPNPTSEIFGKNYVDQETSIRIMSDYIRSVNKHIINRLELTHNDTKKIRYCFTVQFSEKTQSEEEEISSGVSMYRKNLSEAVQLAGICSTNDRCDKIVFVDVYLAMAKYLLKTRKDFFVDREFLICDVDGSYLAIRSMLVYSVGRNIDVKESKVNRILRNFAGDAIDSNFDLYITEVLQSLPEYANCTESEFNTVKNNCKEAFSKTLKYIVDFSIKKDIFLKIPSIPQSKTSSSSYILLNSDELKSRVFDPVVDRICEEIKRVYRNDMKLVFLTGKMSKSIYLKQRIQENICNIVILPEDQVPAAQGAILYGLKKELSIKRLAPIFKATESLLTIGEDKSYLEFPPDKYTHIIGIDFGTNYSKWCIQTTKNPTFLKFDVNDTLCPSLSFYDERLHKQKYWGQKAFDKYYNSSESGKLMNRFKLFIDEIEKHSFDEKTAIEVISSYLRELNIHIHLCMEKNYPDENKSNRFRYCLTLPTIWSDRMKRHMRQAALMANIITESDDHSCLILVSEPEAAAVFFMYDKKFPKLKEQFLRVVVCDAGGGTVDVSTYDYHKNKHDKLYTIHEVNQSSGGVCGSSFLEDKFRDLMKKKCFEKNYTVSKYDTELAIKDFTFRIKTEFSYKDPKKYDLKINVLEKNSVHPKTLTFEKEELKDLVFEPVIAEVMTLIQNQIETAKRNNRHPDVIFLTGGLGQSKYLEEKIRKQYSIPICKSDEYMWGIAKGAVYLAHNPSIISQRFTRKTYGLEVLLEFDSKIDTSLNQVNGLSGMYANSKFDKFVDVNRPVKTKEFYEKTYLVEYPNNTYAALYCKMSEKITTNSTLHPGIKEVSRYLIEMPKIENKKDGELVKIKIRIYFGQTEIDVNTIIDGKVTSQTFLYAPQENIE